jgi:hypothetical protein
MEDDDGPHRKRKRNDEEETGQSEQYAGAQCEDVNEDDKEIRLHLQFPPINVNEGEVREDAFANSDEKCEEEGIAYRESLQPQPEAVAMHVGLGHGSTSKFSTNT